VFPQAAGLEQRLGDLEAQIERLTLALARWRESEEHRQPVEHRLAELTEQCADVLRQWTVTSERHAHAVGELETRLTGWNDVETRLHRDATSRFQGLERTIEREWASLRHVHEAPVRELREQAETLTEISVNAAGSAQTGLERAEARLATLEHDLHRRIDELARDIHAVLAELRQHAPSALRSPASSWSLDEVTRLHH
jgi:chromosome segregation ATPase